MVAAKPDCTGQRFGRLTVLGKGPVVKDPKGRSRRLWNLRCDCGSDVQITRCQFDRKSNGQQSCGCLKKGPINKRQPTDIAGRRFGELVAESLIPDHRIYNSPAWLMRCDCGGTRQVALKYITQLLANGYRVHCGADTHQPGSHYPPTPSPYPKEAAEIAQKYLKLAKWSGKYNDSEIEDERIERLLRSSWIVTCRRESGESISEKHEECFIRKHLRFARTAVMDERRKRKYGRYNKRSIKRGSDVANSTRSSDSAAKAETPKNIKLQKFRRC